MRLNSLLRKPFQPVMGKLLDAIRTGFSVRQLFANNEVGVWYDPSDLTTMYQDSAGTTPVTSVEQPVGLLLDKSKGLVLGAELVTNGGFDSPAGWTIQASMSISGGKLNFTNTTSGFATLPIVFTAGKWYEITCDVIVTSGTQFRLPYDGNAANITFATVTGAYKTRLYSSGSTTLYVAYASAFTGSIDNISVRELPGNHATQSTTTKRPILKIDGNGKYYLLFDGIDDALSTGSIDFTSTDKMTVVAGVRKLSDADYLMVMETSADAGANVGAFFLSTRVNGFEYRSGGSSKAAASISSGNTAPITRVLTAQNDIPIDSEVLRINGAQAASSVADQGIGNCGNYPLFVGSRAGTSLPFNGNLYSLVIRGASSTAAQITSAESYVAQKTGIAL